MSTRNSESTAKLQAILIREVVDLAKVHKDDVSILESITEITFTLSHLFEEMGHSQASDDWNELFNYYDQEHYNLSQHTNKQINDSKLQSIYNHALSVIEHQK